MAADLADLAPMLPSWCAQLDERLQAVEAYRALQQLTLRAAGGKSADDVASAELHPQLERELAALRDYRLLQLLQALDAELTDATATLPAMADAAAPEFEFDAEAAAPEPAKIETVVETVAESVPIVDVALPPFPIDAEKALLIEGDVTVAQWHTDDLRAEASRAVAAMFEGLSPQTVIVDTPPVSSDVPVLETAVSVPPPDIDRPAAPAHLPAGIAPPTAVLKVPERPNQFEIVEAAATVMASLAKLRAAEEEAARASAVTADAAGLTENALLSAATAAVRLAASKLPHIVLAGPAAEPVRPAASVAHDRRAFQGAALAGEATDIRFVERPASPMLDVAPRAKPAPLADVPLTPLIAPRPVAGGDRAAREWEEAVVEIRRAAPDLRPEPFAAHVDPAAALAGRASLAFSRLVKTLKGEKA